MVSATSHLKYVTGKRKLIKITDRKIYKNHFLNIINVYFNFYDEKKRKNGNS
jgi:hypothetical protein